MQIDRNKIAKDTLWINLKTQVVYRVYSIASDATNARCGSPMIVYERDGKVFVRDREEFLERFAPHVLP